MDDRARFPAAPARAGMYESYYLRAVSPEGARGVWIRNTVHKRPGARPTGSVWCTVFGGSRESADAAPYMHKLSASPHVPPDGWIAIGEHARFGPGGARGSCGEARWELRFSGSEQRLEQLPALLYRLPLPRTKLTSPMPAARLDGTLELGDERLELRGWPGMVGHNWGAEHAERWIWLHGTAFEQDAQAWLDVALGRIRIGGRLTPWVANGAISLGGRRRRLGGLRAQRPRVLEGPDGCAVELSGAEGLRVRVRAEVPSGTAAGWRYADPDGGEHDVINCSIARMTLELEDPGGSQTLSTAHGGAYELGICERDHGVPLAPFADGEPYS